ncbi:MAG: CBS domain-containing protein [Deltaproteobacteria bacterium]|nr:CBS domain-containing protein [Deltaproteobacteria bacterium]
MGSRGFACGELSEEDLYDALGELSGYVDVTPGDLRKIYELAWKHASQRLRRAVRVNEVMTRDVATVDRGAPAAEVAERMAERCVSGLPVLDTDGRVAGVVSERDLLPRVGASRPSAMALVAAGLKEGGTLRIALSGPRAEDLMSAPPLTIRDDASVQEALALLLGRGINRLPVVDGEGRLVGIVTRADVMVEPRGDFP